MVQHAVHECMGEGYMHVHLSGHCVYVVCTDEPMFAIKMVWILIIAGWIDGGDRVMRTFSNVTKMSWCNAFNIKCVNIVLKQCRNNSDIHVSQYSCIHFHKWNSSKNALQLNGEVELVGIQHTTALLNTNVGCNCSNDIPYGIANYAISL